MSTSLYSFVRHNPFRQTSSPGISSDITVRSEVVIASMGSIDISQEEHGSVVSNDDRKVDRQQCNVSTPNTSDRIFRYHNIPQN